MVTDVEVPILEKFVSAEEDENLSSERPLLDSEIYRWAIEFLTWKY